jgi:hypothetical protein
MSTSETMPVAPGSKDFYDLRDRAAYVHVTGAMPTHLRSYMTELLNKISRFTGPKGGNSIEIARQNASMLGLEDHPMVKTVRDFLNDGYQIMVARDLKARRPYGKVFLWKDLGHGALSRVAVQSDGSVLSTW